MQKSKYRGKGTTLLIKVEEAGLGVQLNKDRSIGGLLFVDDFVDNSDSSDDLQKLIDVIHISFAISGG